MEFIEEQQGEQLDLLRGLEAIGAFVGLNPRQTQYQISRGLIPVLKQGRLIVASKAKLREYFGATVRPVAPRQPVEQPAPKRRGPGRPRKASMPAATPVVASPPLQPQEQPPPGGDQ